MAAKEEAQAREGGDSSKQPTVIYENRPNSRAKHSLYGQYKRYINGDKVQQAQ